MHMLTSYKVRGFASVGRYMHMLTSYKVRGLIHAHVD